MDYRILLSFLLLLSLHQLGAVERIDSTVVIRNCEIYSNTADSHGGGLYIKEAAYVVASIVANNLSKGSGGAIAMDPAGVVDNCLIANNTANNLGGGIWARNGNASIVSTTIVNNLLSGSKGVGSGVSLPQTAMIVNSIVCRNKKDPDPAYTIQLSSTGAVEYCAIEGTTVAGAGNIFIDSNSNMLRFKNPIATIGYSSDKEDWRSADWRIISGSVSIDKGSNEALYSVTDLSEGGRIIGDATDMGCYEYSPESGIIESAFYNTRCQIYPNPIVDQSFSFINGYDDTVRVDLSDLTGRVIASYRVSAEQTATLQTGSLPSGVYIATMRVANEIKEYAKLIKK